MLSYLLLELATISQVSMSSDSLAVSGGTGPDGLRETIVLSPNRSWKVTWRLDSVKHRLSFIFIADILYTVH